MAVGEDACVDAAGAGAAGADDDDEEENDDDDDNAYTVTRGSGGVEQEVEWIP